jgi:adenylate cyclase
MHTGPAVAGVIATEKVRLRRVGDTVNVASRLETSAEPKHPSPGLHNAARDTFPAEPLGTMALKGGTRTF